MGDGETHTVDFLNSHLGSITVTNFLDQDGDFRTPEGSLKNWGMKLLRVSGSDTVVVDSVVSASTLSVVNVPEATYIAAEADSAYPWTHIGTELWKNGVLLNRLGGTQNTISFSFAGGQDYHARFINFNRNRVKLWTAAVNCIWSNAYNWDPPGVPIQGDSIVVPDTARCALVIPTGSTLGMLAVASNESVHVHSGTSFSVTGDMTINGALVVDSGDTSHIVVSGNLDILGNFTAGLSSFILNAADTQHINVQGQSFFNLQIGDSGYGYSGIIASGHHQRSGVKNAAQVPALVRTETSLKVNHLLTLNANLDAAGDTIYINTADPAAVIGAGILTRGSLVRIIQQGSEEIYRFESGKSTIQFNGAGAYPYNVCMTAFPNTTPTSFGGQWIEVPSVVDTANNTITANGVSKFSRWVFGVPRPQTTSLFVNRIYSIAAKSGSGYSCTLKLRYDQSEIPFGVREDSLRLMKLPDETGRTLAAGWNLISLPCIPDSNGKAALFPTAISNAFYYEDRYLRADTLVNGKGYWLKFSAPETLRISGTPISKDSIDVLAGWNLIGSISAGVSVTAIRSVPPGLATSNLYGYSNSYFVCDTIKPGYGYWVKVNQTGKLILSSPATMGLAKASSNQIRIIPTDELPPPPPVEAIAMAAAVPKEYALEQNYPNPFNPVTMLKYSLPVESRVKLTTFNVLGQVVATLVDGSQQAGYRSVEWNASAAASGIYFYKLEAVSVADPTKTFASVKKMLLVR